MSEFTQRTSGGKCNFHMNEAGTTFFLFDQTHGTFCGLLVDTTVTTCAKEMEWINGLSEREVLIHAYFVSTDLYYVKKGMIRKGWTDSMVGLVWGEQTKVLYEIDNKKSVEYGSERIVTYVDGVVESFIDLK